MKRLLNIFMAAILSASMIICYSPLYGNAETSASIRAKADKTEVEKGGNISVTVSLTSGTEFAYLSYKLSYDASLVTFIPEGDQEDANGTILERVDSAKGQKTFSATYKFVSKAVGTVGFSLSDVKNIDLETVTDIQTSITNSSVKIIEKAKSGNNKLKSMQPSAGSLSPKFSPDVTEYTVNVPAGTSVCYLYCDAADTHAKTALQGSEFLKVGENIRKCIVTAENGDTKTYTVKIVRPNDPTAKPTEKPTAKPTGTESPSATEEPEKTPEIPSEPIIGDVVIGEDKYKIYNVKDEISSELKNSNIINTQNFLFGDIVLNGIPAYDKENNTQYIVMAEKEKGNKQIYIFDAEDKSIQRYMGDIENIVNCFDIEEKGEEPAETTEVATESPAETELPSETSAATKAPTEEGKKTLPNNSFLIGIGIVGLLFIVLIVLAIINLTKKD